MNTQQCFAWSVIGAGPAGIAAIGKLLDAGINPKEILWIDPYFTVGDLGRYWSNVSSNTKVKLFLDFLESVPAFNFKEASNKYVLHELNPNDTCTLGYMVEPLQHISDALVRSVHAEKTSIHSMNLANRCWTLEGEHKNYQSKNVILATGAVPSSLNYPGLKVIPFDTAIDKEKLKSVVNKHDVVGVFGSSHSAIIIVRNLVELGIKQVINFYRSPCRYAIDMKDWILFDNTGLKGQTASWAREYIDGTLPHNLVRYNTTEANIARYLPECTSVIYAVGFEKRKTIVIGDYEDTHHNPHVGIIGPGLFGLGIAYPETRTDPAGCIEKQVGLWKFMVYLNKVLPIWFKYPT